MEQDGLPVACLSKFDGKYLVVVLVNSRMTGFTRNTPHVRLHVSGCTVQPREQLSQSSIWNHPYSGKYQDDLGHGSRIPLACLS